MNSKHTKKNFIKISIGSEDFSIPSKEAKAILSLVKSINKSYSNSETVSSDKVYKDNFGRIPKSATFLKGARGKENMSQSELSKKTGIPVTTVSKYENGDREISEGQAKKLGKALNINFKVFLV